MSPGNRELTIEEARAKGDEALAAARLLAGAGHLDSATSRLYYAVFSYVSAALATCDVFPRRHSAIPGLVGQHLQSTHRLPVTTSGAIHRLFDRRMLAEYQGDWHQTPAGWTEDLASAEGIIESVRDLLDTSP